MLHKAIQYQLREIGEDPEREGLKDTPERVLRSWDHLYWGYRFKDDDVGRMLTKFDCETYDQVILLKDIEVYSMCEHHMLPFFGKAHVAYLPHEKIVGISKLARLIEVYARRLQIQERIGEQVTDALMTHLKPRGAACIIEAQHMCMTMRGVEKQNSVMVTSSMKGAFLQDGGPKDELIKLIQG